MRKLQGGGAVCLCLPAAQRSLTSALPLPSLERACTQETCWDGLAEGLRCSSRDAGEDAAPARLTIARALQPRACPVLGTSSWCTPHIALSQGHCTALHPFTPLTQSQAAFFLSLLLFLPLKGHCGKERGPKKSGSLLPGKQV